MLRLLIAADTDAERQAAGELLAELGFSVTACASALDAMTKCVAIRPDIVIVDADMEGALDLIANLRLMPDGKAVRVLYGVAQADLRKLMAAKRAGADDFLLKPFEAKVLHALFAEMLARAAAA